MINTNENQMEGFTPWVYYNPKKNYDLIRILI